MSNSPNEDDSSHEKKERPTYYIFLTALTIAVGCLGWFMS